MEMQFLSKGIDRYLNVPLGSIEDIMSRGEYYKVRMLEENSIEHMMRPIFSQTDNMIYLRYNTGIGNLLNRVLMNIKVDSDMLKLIVGQVVHCIEIIGDFLLQADDLVVLPEYMLYEVEEKRVKLMYVPGYNVPIRQQLKKFLEYIMKVFDHRDKRGIGMLYNIYDYICEDVVDVQVIKSMLLKEEPFEEQVLCKPENLEEHYQDNITVNGDREKKSNIEKIVLWGAGCCFILVYFFSGKEIFLLGAISFFAMGIWNSIYFSSKRETSVAKTQIVYDTFGTDNDELTFIEDTGKEKRQRMSIVEH
ncbi:MAG: hypothetical protein E7258_03510 [Lachnospiraceae bacterium]|nr:hypothetical protein [Lachnospiraceae bacterium]